LLTLAACGLRTWVIYRLVRALRQGPLRMAEELAAVTTHSGLRLPEYGATPELRALGQAANQLLGCATR
jgi:hypothetical protein